MTISGDNIVEIIKVIGSLVATLVVPYMAFRMRKLEANMEIVHKATNSMKDDLVAEVRQASFAAGVKAKTKRDARKKSPEVAPASLPGRDP